MKKNLFTRITHSNDNIKTNHTANSQTIVLFPELPYYGKKGTIYRVEETPNSYDKIVYNHDGTINPVKISTPKRKGKNLTLVTKEYYNDLKKYLEISNNQYMNYKNNRLKKYRSKKQINRYMCASAIMIFLSVPIWFSSIQMISYIGAIIEASSILSFYITFDLKKKITKDEQKKNFIEQYNNYKKSLIEYKQQNQKLNQKEKTKYTEISSKKQTISHDKTKVKELKLQKELEGSKRYHIA